MIADMILYNRFSDLKKMIIYNQYLCFDLMKFISLSFIVNNKNDKKLKEYISHLSVFKFPYTWSEFVKYEMYMQCCK